ncbi:type II toxin-antitoxin system VapC family toxin [Spirosoma sp. KCTC 42546]|uniref:type II toxin-antitoxin system VapC family toxin n=1 Tax=Spirosoma sp. KCTC 42546 TaxID=2520506 RepID=UPI001157924C|nr:type II toxin-antitoxin system VapC family toxin [Spirosoma sp. KCTC 42546]QDK77974.1 type II toxin-antitoxin system VapC family toxin [Spirosoma sp. KCTC 42546]
MKYLLDTHILIWLLTDNPKLSSTSKVILADETNEFFFSTESVREMILKAKTGKLTLPADIDLLLFELQDELGIRLLTVKPKHLKQLYTLETPANHKDPFDHLLICQAIAEKLIMISADRNFPYYRIQGLQLVENTI